MSKNWFLFHYFLVVFEIVLTNGDLPIYVIFYAFVIFWIFNTKLHNLYHFVVQSHCERRRVPFENNKRLQNISNWSCRLTREQEPCHVKGIFLCDRLCTTLASVLRTSILLKNLQKTKWCRCGRSRSDAQVSDWTTKILREKLRTPGTVQCSLSAYSSSHKRKEVF